MQKPSVGNHGAESLSQIMSVRVRIPVCSDDLTSRTISVQVCKNDSVLCLQNLVAGCMMKYQLQQTSSLKLALEYGPRLDECKTLCQYGIRDQDMLQCWFLQIGGGCCFSSLAGDSSSEPVSAGTSNIRADTVTLLPDVSKKSENKQVKTFREPETSAEGKRNQFIYSDVSRCESKISICKFETHFDGLQNFKRVPKSLSHAMTLLQIGSIEFSQILELKNFDFDIILLIKTLSKFTCTKCPVLTSLFSSSTEACKNSILSIINISENLMLSSIPLRTFVDIPSVMEVDCSSCPCLWSPPPEISRQGGKATIDFLREVQYGGEFNRYITLFLLGEGEAGKTSVVRALMSETNTAEKIAEDTRTVGVEICNWSPQGADVIYNILDLAGQAVYAKTHRPLLQRRALYFLVWRASDSLLQDTSVMSRKIDVWLDSLQYQIPGAFVMLIVTHIDECSPETLRVICQSVQNLVLDRLKYYAASVKDGTPILNVLHNGESFAVDCIKGNGIAALRDRTINVTQSMPWYREPLPASWVKFRDLIQNCVESSQVSLEWDCFKRMAEQAGLKGSQFDLCVKFLHETGVIRYFGDLVDASPILKSTVFISVSYMVNIMKGLIRHDRDSLIQYFMEINDKRMLRRVQRYMVTGRLHCELVPYLWPPGIQGEASRAYWNWTKSKSTSESNLWKVEVIRSQNDLISAIGLLGAFDLLGLPPDVALHKDEYVVPCAMKDIKPQITDDAFIRQLCPFSKTLVYHCKALPSGAIESIFVRISHWACQVEFSANACVYYSFGHMGQLMLCTDVHGNAQISLKCSSIGILKQSFADIVKMEASYPGISRKETISVEANSSKLEAIQVCILSNDEQSAKTVITDISDARRQTDMHEITTLLQLPTNNVELEVDCRIVLVLLNSTLADLEHSCNQFAAHIKHGSKIVPILMPGFTSRPLPNWWPESMPGFRKHKLFCDFRKVSDRKRNLVILVAQIDKYLKAWRAGSATAAHNVDGAIRCKNCLENGVEFSACVEFSVQECINQIDDFVNLKNAGKSEFSKISMSCPKCLFEHDLEELMSNSTIKEVVPCPLCLTKGVFPPGSFISKECRLYLHEHDKHREATVVCSVCSGASSVMDVAPPEVFYSYNWGQRQIDGTYSNQERVRPLVTAVEYLADVYCWFDVGGGMGFGQDQLQEMKQGVILAKVVVIFLSDAYVNSPNCQREYIHASRLNKHLIPILVPNEGTEWKPGVSFGWSGPGPEDPDWWTHILKICKDNKNPDDSSLSIDWEYIGNFAPLQMTLENTQQLIDEIVRRVMFRLNRVVKLPYHTDEQSKLTMLEVAKHQVDGSSVERILLHESQGNPVHTESGKKHISIEVNDQKTSQGTIESINLNQSSALSSDIIQAFWEDPDLESCLGVLSDFSLISLKKNIDQAIWKSLFSGTPFMKNLKRVDLR